jgi:aprataxin and PNK-like factor
MSPVKKNKKKKKGTEQTANAPGGRPKCSYGQGCYRKNPVHFQQECHPGDDDYQESDQRDSDDEGENDDKPECEFGVDCYRKNAQHKKDFKHTHYPQPKRKAKQKARKKKGRDSDDEYESDFIDDEEDLEEDIDDTDEDENWTPPDSDED